jgi:hypothetical protein
MLADHRERSMVAVVALRGSSSPGLGRALADGVLAP